MSKFPKLFIPGPTHVSSDILQELSTEQIGHRTPEISELIKISDIELPPIMIERETQNEIEQLENLAKRFKMSLEDYLTQNNQNLDETKENIETETFQKLNRTFTLLEVCKQNNIIPTEQELSEAEKNLKTQQSNNKNSPK